MSSEERSIPLANGDAAKEDLIDITSIVEKCAESLSVSNPFLCDPVTFSLQDAMAASQLADRKMDCCEIPIGVVAPFGTEINDQNRTIFPRPSPTSLDSPFSPLKWETLTETDALFISLHILIRLQSLLTGASVGESTFTCLYAHSPVLADMEMRLFSDASESLSARMERLMADQKPNGTPAQLVVFASALALVETTEVTRGIIQNADIYEEEDFVASTNLIPFYTDNFHIDTMQMLQLALSATDTVKDKQPDIVEALQLILGFQLGFLSVISSMAKLAAGSLTSEVTRMKETANLTTKKLEDLSAMLERLLEGDGASEAIQATLRQSFDAYVNRPLVGNAPVRKVFFREPKEAISILHAISAELEWAVCDFILQGSSLGRIQRLLDRLAPANVNILSRSLIILNLYFEEKILGQYPIRQLILHNLRQWINVPEALLASDPSQAFLNRLAKPIYDTLKLKTLNKNRQRAYIEIVMLPEWVSLQDEAHLVDVHYRQMNNLDSTVPPYFSQYVLTIVIRLMERYLASGMELGLFYSHDELSHACWYRDFLLSALLNNLTVMKRTKTLPTKTKETTSSNTSKGGRGKKKNNKQKSNGGTEVKASPEDNEDDIELMALGLKRNLCRGVIRFLAALRQAGLLKESNHEFTTLERTFAERFHAFSMVRQPPPLSYEHYQEGSDFSQVKQEDLLQTTAEWFQSCRKTADQLLASSSSVEPVYAAMQEKEIRALIKVCVGNSVYLQRLRQIASGQSSTKVTVSFDFATHDQFCIIKLS